MAKSGDVLDLTPLGVRVELLRTPERTGGDLLEFDVVGRARGILAGGHIHTSQAERLEVLSGAMKLTIDGRKHLLTTGQAMEGLEPFAQRLASDSAREPSAV